MASRLGFSDDMLDANLKSPTEQLGEKELAHNAVQSAMGAT